MTQGRKHLVIPDLQVKPGVPTEHLDWIAQYAIDKRPDVIVQIGDWVDFPSLSSYDVGTKKFEGRRIAADIEAGNASIARFNVPIDREIARRTNLHKTRWNPRKVFTKGNHEDRPDRAINMDPKLDGLLKPDALVFKEYGFEVYPFLQPVVVDGIAYCHYFASGVMGRPITTARALLTKQHMSCFAGHQQGKDIAYGKRGDGTRLTAIISGSCYLHDEDYLNPQTNNVWKGIWVLNEVNDGSFDEMPVSLSFLKERYG
jgi:hypothetical protein